jgi:hypothetical protein
LTTSAYSFSFAPIINLQYGDGTSPSTVHRAKNKITTMMMSMVSFQAQVNPVEKLSDESKPVPA